MNPIGIINIVCVCPFCNRIYGSKKAFLKHARLKHPKNICETTDSQTSRLRYTRRERYICSTCDERFSNKLELKKHIFKNHIPGAQQRTAKSRISCAYEDCKVHLRTYKNYRVHLSSSHHIETKEKKLEFSHHADFIRWKEEYESKHSVSYVQDTGRKTVKSSSGSSSYIVYYNCHRSFTPNITSGKRTKFVGSRKIGRCCPSRIRVIASQDGIVAYFINTHVGHKCEPDKISLNSNEKQEIARKLLDGVSLERILEDIESSVPKLTDDPDSLKRIHLTNKRDLRNIRREFNIDSPAPGSETSS